MKSRWICRLDTYLSWSPWNTGSFPGGIRFLTILVSKGSDWRFIWSTKWPTDYTDQIIEVVPLISSKIPLFIYNHCRACKLAMQKMKKGEKAHFHVKELWHNELAEICMSLMDIKHHNRTCDALCLRLWGTYSLHMTLDWVIFLEFYIILQSETSSYTNYYR